MCQSRHARKQLQHIRDRKAARQRWRCIYCDQPMWRRDPMVFAERYGLTLRQAHLLQVTAEHLLPRSDGGKDSYANIAAACSFCNLKRHKARKVLFPAAYAQKVRDQLKQGRWHGIRLGAVAQTERQFQHPPTQHCGKAGDPEGPPEVNGESSPLGSRRSESSNGWRAPQPTPVP